jgi:hypothetical protein
LTPAVGARLLIYIGEKFIAFGLARKVGGHVGVQRRRKQEDRVGITVKRQQQGGHSRNVLTPDCHARTFKAALTDFSGRAEQISYRAVVHRTAISRNPSQ